MHERETKRRKVSTDKDEDVPASLVVELSMAATSGAEHAQMVLDVAFLPGSGDMGDAREGAKSGAARILNESPEAPGGPPLIGALDLSELGRILNGIEDLPKPAPNYCAGAGTPVPEAELGGAYFEVLGEAA